MKSGRKPTFLLHEDKNELTGRIRDMGAAAVADTGVELVEVQLKGAGGSRLLRLYIDKAGGVTHGDCEMVSERVGQMLDENDVIPDDQPYTLEVSSLGPDRKLVTARDFERVVGHVVDITAQAAADSQMQYRGRLLGVDTDHLVIGIPNSDTIRVPIVQVRKAKLRFEP